MNKCSRNPKTVKTIYFAQAEFHRGGDGHKVLGLHAIKKRMNTTSFYESSRGNEDFLRKDNLQDPNGHPLEEEKECGCWRIVNG